jgi:hypothetical protein
MNNNIPKYNNNKIPKYPEYLDLLQEWLYPELPSQTSPEDLFHLYPTLEYIWNG